MCKFNQFSVLFIVCCAQLIQIGVTIPLGTLLFDDYDVDEEIGGDYDLHYDQRQNGTANHRLNINGVVFVLPGASSSTMNNIGSLASNYLLGLAASQHGSDNEDDSVENDDEYPYDFETPSGSQPSDDHVDEIEGDQPVVVISPEPVTTPSVVENETVAHQDLKPENSVDAINDKESTTNKKDLKVEIVQGSEALPVASDRPLAEAVDSENAAKPTRRRKISAKAASKRRNR